MPALTDTAVQPARTLADSAQILEQKELSPRSSLYADLREARATKELTKLEVFLRNATRVDKAYAKAAFVGNRGSGKSTYLLDLEERLEQEGRFTQKTQSRGKVPPPPDRSAVPGLDERSAERRGMGIFLRQTTAFRLALALYNDPVARDEIIRSLREELAGQGVRVLTLDLRAPAEEHTLLSRVEAVVKSANLAPGERWAVMVVNLESQVDYTPELARPSGPGTAYLENANFHRELFPGVCPAPVVIWMTELLERAFVGHAPDLWHWRSHVFDLRTRSTPRESATK